MKGAEAHLACFLDSKRKLLPNSLFKAWVGPTFRGAAFWPILSPALRPPFSALTMEQVPTASRAPGILAIPDPVFISQPRQVCTPGLSLHSLIPIRLLPVPLAAGPLVNLYDSIRTQLGASIR